MRLRAQRKPAMQDIKVAPGILLVRLALFRLDHVNVYLIEDGAGWAVIDTGLDDATTRAAWDTLLAGPLRGRNLTRILVTHYHPDHMGLAGWLRDRFGLRLMMSQTEYLVSLTIHLDPAALNAEPHERRLPAWSSPQPNVDAGPKTQRSPSNLLLPRPRSVPIVLRFIGG